MMSTPNAVIMAGASLFVGVALGIPVGAAFTEPAELRIPASVTAEPLEDEPGWDCRVHGNRSCVVSTRTIFEPTR